MRYGPIHVFNLCDRASDQATLFLSTVPRDNAMLPPVVRLSFIPKCKRRPARAAVLSELNTFLNLIEAHMGKPALIRVSRDFDAAYNIGEGRSEEHTSELQSLMRISYAVFCLKKKTTTKD